MINIELEELFKNALDNGINIFTGAGFSTLAKDRFSKELPVGIQLKEELCKEFSVSSSLDLAQISTILESTKKENFLNYLTERFKVGEFSDKYKILAEINLKSIFTTNIDDLPFEIFESSANKYLNDITEFGPSLDKTAIDFIPLHGNVLRKDKGYTFSTVDIASAFSNESNVWNYLRTITTKDPILFIGYSLSDAGVIQALFNKIDKSKQSKTKWILLRKNDDGAESYFKSLGFNIIIGSTESLLDYFIQYTKEREVEERTQLVNKGDYVFSKESLPKLSSKLTVRPLKNFYLGDAPIWSDIYSNRIPKLNHFEKLLNLINGKKNVILIGLPASGKTTLMMQVASSINFKGHKLICTEISLEKAKLITSHLLSDPALIFMDNFTDSVNVYEHFELFENIKIVAVDRQYNYEIISHRINKSKAVIYDCSPLNTHDVQKVYNSIPEDIRKSRLISELRENIEPSIFDIINLNINHPTINERYTSVIKELDNTDSLALDFLIMCSYVNSCRTPVSFDMANSFLSDELGHYSEVYEIIESLGELIQEYSGNIIVDVNQDYFSPRSSIISEAILRQTPTSIFKRVYEKFHNNVPKYAIVRFDIFKKKAYDSDFVRKAFSNWYEGRDFYEKVSASDGSPFILQQGALYLSNKKRYSEAFNWIDEALMKSSKNYFSIRNTHAIILFEANINSEDREQARIYLDQSMNILKDCYRDDKRKTYHTVTFAKQAIQYYSAFGDAKGLENIKCASNWLDEEIAVANWNRELRRLKLEIKPLLL